MSETELLSRSGIVRELAQEIRSLETAQRPQGIYVSSGSESMDRCLPNCGYAAGSLVELTCERPSLFSGWGGLSLYVSGAPRIFVFDFLFHGCCAGTAVAVASPGLQCVHWHSRV